MVIEAAREKGAHVLAWCSTATYFATSAYQGQGNPSATHQRPPEIPLPSSVVDACEELVEIRPLFHRLLPESVRPTHVSCRDYL